MTTADRLHQAATRLHETVAQGNDGTGGWYTAQELNAVLGRDSLLIALMSPALATELAGWLDDIAADKASGLTTIHPSAAAIADLILGDTP